MEINERMLELMKEVIQALDDIRKSGRTPAAIVLGRSYHHDMSIPVLFRIAGLPVIYDSDQMISVSIEIQQ